MRTIEETILIEPTPLHQTREVRVGIVGYGTVGRATAEILALNAEEIQRRTDRVQAVYGIVNGTANFILTQMESHGMEFGEALRQAQEAGYAEADPSLDIDGLDARDKIAILARLAFHGALSPADIRVTGIRQVSATDFHYAQRLNSTIRLVASAERNAQGINVSERPRMLRSESILAKDECPHSSIYLVCDID